MARSTMYSSLLAVTRTRAAVIGSTTGGADTAADCSAATRALLRAMARLRSSSLV